MSGRCVRGCARGSLTLHPGPAVRWAERDGAGWTEETDAGGGEWSGAGEAWRKGETGGRRLREAVVGISEVRV